MNKMTLFYIGLLFAYVIGILLWIQKVEAKVDRTTELVCAFYAPIRKEEYKGTQWENFNFYQSCIDNVFCANPMNCGGK